MAKNKKRQNKKQQKGNDVAAEAENRTKTTENKEGDTPLDLASLLANATPEQLKAALKTVNAGKTKETAKEKASEKLSKLRIYVVRQNVWADKATKKAVAAQTKADEAVTKLEELEKRLGVKPATEEEVAAILLSLQTSGRVAQVNSAELTEPSEAEVQEAEAESRKADEAATDAA